MDEQDNTATQQSATERHMRRMVVPAPCGSRRARPARGRGRCWPGWASLTGQLPTRGSCRAASNCGWPSPGRGRCSRG